MSSRVEAGRLAHVDLGKTIEVPATAKPARKGALLGVEHFSDGVYLRIGTHAIDGARLLDPHTLVTIAGKDQP